MNAAAAPGRDRAVRLATGLLIAYLGVFFASHVINVLRFSSMPVAALALGAAFFLVLAVEFLPAPARLRARIGWPPLVLLALLAYVPFPWFDDCWFVPPVLFGGMVLLRLRAPASWWAFGAVVPAYGLLFLTSLSGDSGERLWLLAYTVFGVLSTGLVAYGFGRLAGLVVAVRATQDRLASDAVLAERLRAARTLDGLLGTALTGVADAGRAALRRPGAAGAAFRPVVRSTRESLEQVRGLAARYSAPDSGIAGAGAGDEMSPRLAVPILIGVHGGYILYVIASQPLRPDGLAGPRLAGLVILLIAIFGLQVRHTMLRTRLAGTAGALATLAGQAALTGVAISIQPETLSVTLGFLVGTVLLLVAAPWSWSLAAAIMSGATGHAALGAGLRGWDLALFVLASLHLALVAYGLTRLTELARQLRDARAERARLAVLGERLRFARDVHDLFGLTLSAIILKGELVCRIAGRDPARARQQLTEIVELAETALGELRSGAGDGGLSLAAESSSARRLLSAVGVQVRGRVRARPAGTEMDAALAVVVREAVTNVLRHSAARRVTLETSQDGDRIRMRVANDGAPAAAAGPPGSGIANLTARIEAVGGTLSARPRGPGFELVAEVPAGPAAVASQPAGLGGDPDGVEPVAGAELGHHCGEDVADRPA